MTEPRAERPAQRAPEPDRLPRRRGHILEWIAAVVLSTGALSGCATSSFMHRAERAEIAGDYDLAVVEYTKALRKDPGNRHARQSLEVVKLRSAGEHFTRGRRYAYAGKLDEALVEFQLASELNPASKEIED